MVVVPKRVDVLRVLRLRTVLLDRDFHLVNFRLDHQKFPEYSLHSRRGPKGSQLHSEDSGLLIREDHNRTTGGQVPRRGRETKGREKGDRWGLRSLSVRCFQSHNAVSPPRRRLPDPNVSSITRRRPHLRDVDRGPATRLRSRRLRSGNRTPLFAHARRPHNTPTST